MELDREGLEAAMAGFSAGETIPAVDSAIIKKMVKAGNAMMSDAQLTSNPAIGLAAYAGYGFDASSLRPQELLAVSFRVHLLDALIRRGVLNEYLQDETLCEKLYLAAATIPLDENGLAEALLLLELTQAPAETATKVRKELMQEGCDTGTPEIDKKFVAWLKERC